VKVFWTRAAISHLYALHSYIQERNHGAADEVVNKVTGAVEWLSNNAKAGRLGRVPDTREWVVRQTPYIVAYDITPSAMRILAVMHGAQQWPKAFTKDMPERIN
jgi:toxin ParE1/3/4